MGSKPKQSDYKASESEKASAAVAQAEYNYFKEKYDPLLQNMRDQALSDDNRQALRKRASADTMQALSAPSLAATQDVTRAGSRADALTGQLGVAETSAKNIANTMATNVLGTARGQAADAQSGMAKASRLATSDALARARNKEAERAARTQALGQIAGASIAAAGEKYGSKLDTRSKIESGKGYFPFQQKRLVDNPNFGKRVGGSVLGNIAQRTSSVLGNY